MEPRILRLFRFRPTAPGFDATLRSVLVPGLLRSPGLVGAFVGRFGPDEEGERLIASVWESAAAMAAAVGADDDSAVLVPERLEATVDRCIATAPLAFTFPPTRPTEVGILRLVEGRTRPGELEPYVDEARAGTLADRAAAIGPQALYLAAEPPDRFITLSLWDSWADVEAATGADSRHTDRTRHAERLVSWAAEHYEVVPGIAVTMIDEPARPLG